MVRAVLAAVVLLFAGASAAFAVEPAFDPVTATRAWIATIGPEALERSNAYYTGNYAIELISGLIGVAVAAALLFAGFGRRLRGWLERTVKFYPLVVFCMAFAFILVTTLITFPLSYYVDFVREHEFGLATQTFAEWFNEYLISAALSLVIGSIFLVILYLIMAAAKKTWWIWGSVVTTICAAVLIMAGPIYIDPLFNTYTAMEEGELKDDILAMAQANGVPADNVWVVDTSRQSNRITANVAGLFGTTRVALGDNLLSRASPEAVRAVMGHELGHYVLGHIYSILLMLTALIFVVFAAVHFSFQALAKNERWGIRSIADAAGLPLFMALVSAISLVSAPLQRQIVYFHEQQADMFGLNAARAPDGFAEAAVLLSEYRKMEPGALEEWFFYDHPSGWNRIHNAMVWKANQIAVGDYPLSPGGPPAGWRPDFVVDDAANPASSPAAE